MTLVGRVNLLKMVFLPEFIFIVLEHSPSYSGVILLETGGAGGVLHLGWSDPPTGQIHCTAADVVGRFILEAALLGSYAALSKQLRQ